jgi:general secretion pathway protein I
LKRATSHPRRRSRGFTLIEVMVAVAILAMSLTAIFASEAGAAKVAHRSRKMGLAALAARCKMNEIEEQIADEGLPALFDSGSDACCEETPTEGVTCDWEIELVTLPDTMFAPEEPESGSPEGSDKSTGPGDKTGDKPPTDPSDKTQKGSPTDPMTALREIDPEEALAGGGLGGMAAMALGYAYPVLKPAFEAQIRRATVTVHWREGSRDHSFDVTQYVVAERPSGPAAQDPSQSSPGGQDPTVPPATPPGTGSTQTLRGKATL